MWPRSNCRSPDCNAWKTISRVKTPQRLAAFVEGDSHLSDNEVIFSVSSSLLECTQLPKNTICPIT